MTEIGEVNGFRCGMFIQDVNGKKMLLIKIYDDFGYSENKGEDAKVLFLEINHAKCLANTILEEIKQNE